MFNNDTAKELLKKTVKKIGGHTHPQLFAHINPISKPLLNTARKSNKMHYQHIQKQSSPLSKKYQMGT
jgi:hypothetical protein